MGALWMLRPVFRLSQGSKGRRSAATDPLYREGDLNVWKDDCSTRKSSQNVPTIHTMSLHIFIIIYMMILYVYIYIYCEMNSCPFPFTCRYTIMPMHSHAHGNNHDHPPDTLGWGSLGKVGGFSVRAISYLLLWPALSRSLDFGAQIIRSCFGENNRLSSAAAVWFSGWRVQHLTTIVIPFTLVAELP